ncbi:hypothetical protein C1I97_06055 [Streptomyces sp. NTH33]|nr:hypothetical protein C1I97_06055 [Streptomyces sp. NTH33]
MAGQRLRDLAERRTDKALKAALMAVADSWSETTRHGVPFGSYTPDIADRRAYDLRAEQARAAQRQVAGDGLERVKEALSRLNELERKTHGRS